MYMRWIILGKEKRISSIVQKTNNNHNKRLKPSRDEWNTRDYNNIITIITI